MFIDNDSFIQNKESDYNSNIFNNNMKKDNNYLNYSNSFTTSSSGKSFDLLSKQNNIDNDNLNFTSNSFFKNNYNRNNDLQDNIIKEKKTFKNQIKQEVSQIGNLIKNTISKVPETINKISPFSNNEQSNLTNYNNENDNFLSDNYKIISRPSSANSFGINSNSFNSLLQSKDQIDINEYNLSVCVSNCESKYSGTEEIIFFQIDLYSNLSKKEWSLFRKYKEFFEMNLIFEKYYTTVPIFPGSSFPKLTDPNDIILKKDKLNIYLKEVCKRPDLLTSIYCVKFLRLENHYPNIQLHYPLELYDLHGELVLPISCGYFLENANLLFIGCGKAQNSIFQGIKNKIKNFSFFKKKNNNQIQKKVLGQIAIFNIIKNYQDNYHFEVLYAKPTYSECTSINFYKDKNCLCLGMNDGTINLYKIFINENTEESQGQFLIEAGNFQAHNVKIIGTIINFNQGYIYTIANENYIKIFDLNYKTLLKEYLIAIKSISSMIYDEKLGRVILGDEGGNVYIIDIISNPINPQIIIKFTVSTETMITTIYFNIDNNIMIFGVKGGKVLFYKINNYDGKNCKYNKVEFNKIKEMNISPMVTINKIVLTERGEMLFALSNGSINVYYDNDQIPEFVIDAHLRSIPDMFYEEKKKNLITLSEDKSLKMVQLPVYYPDQMLKNEKYEKKHLDKSIEKLFGLNTNKNNNKINEYENNNNDEFNNNDNNDNSFVIGNLFGDNQSNSNDEKIQNSNKKIRSKNQPLSENEIWSYDLDGWSFDMAKKNN